MSSVANSDNNSILKFSPNDLIFKEGEYSKCLYIVKSGEVYYLKNKGKHLALIEIAKSKDILNEVSVFSNSKNTFHAVAKTNVEIVKIDKSDIDTFLKSGPSWVKNILSALCEKIQNTEEIISEHKLNNFSQEPVLSKVEEEKLLAVISKGG